MWWPGLSCSPSQYWCQQRVPLTFCNMSILQVVRRRQPGKEHTCSSAAGAWAHRVNCPPSVRPQQEIGVLPKNIESLNYGLLNCSPRSMSTQLREQLLSLSLGDKRKACAEWWERRTEPRLWALAGRWANLCTHPGVKLMAAEFLWKAMSDVTRRKITC